MFNPDLYQKAIQFAARAHKGQKVPGSNLPYLLHVSNVCAEAMIALGKQPLAGQENHDIVMQVALLHDTIEDTSTTEDDVRAEFGDQVAVAVSALSKDSALPKEKRMNDSLERIVKAGPEARIVKMADRITNLQRPPEFWSGEKKANYLEQARQILAKLGGVHEVIEKRLSQKIDEYRQYL